MYEFAVSLLPECVLTYYLIFKTHPFNIDLYKHLFHMFELNIRIVTCIYVELIKNISIPNLEFTGIN